MKHSFFLYSTALIFFLLSATVTQAQGTNSKSYKVALGKSDSAQQSPSFEMKVQPDSTGERFRVTISNPEKKKLQLSIYHPVFGTVYSQDVNQEYLGKYFNLGQAEDGEYTIEVLCGQERYTQKLSINTFTEVSRRIEMN